MRLLLWIITIGCIAIMAEMLTGCAGDGKQTTWERCGGINHTECSDPYFNDPYYQHEDYLDCEYEYYKECIDG